MLPGKKSAVRHRCSKLLSKSSADLCRVLTCSKIWLSYISDNVAFWMHHHICRCCQMHIRILLQHLRAVWLAPGENGSTCNYLKAPVRLTAVSERLACGFWTRYILLMNKSTEFALSLLESEQYQLVQVVVGRPSKLYSIIPCNMITDAKEQPYLFLEDIVRVHPLCSRISLDWKLLCTILFRMQLCTWLAIDWKWFKGIHIQVVRKQIKWNTPWSSIYEPLQILSGMVLWSGISWHSLNPTIT